MADNITAMRSSDDDTTITLDARIQALPQELQDTILSFTDAFHIPDTQNPRRKRYKPPVALQLNRKLRAKFAQEYYSSVIFEGFGLFDLIIWLRSLRDHHKVLVRNLQLTLSPCHELSSSQRVGTGVSGTLKDCFGKMLSNVKFVLAYPGKGSAKQTLFMFDMNGQRLLE